MNLFSWLLFAALSNAEEDNVALQLQVAAGDIIQKDKFASGDTVRLSIDSDGDTETVAPWGTYSVGQYKAKTAMGKETEPTCQNNAIPVTTVASCEEYAKSVGQVWGEEFVANLPNFPRGCTVRRGQTEFTGVWWNAPAREGSWNQHPGFKGEVALVCISPEPDQTFTPEPGFDCIVGERTIHAITGSHSVHMELRMPSYTDVKDMDVRQWILNIGQQGVHAHHWLWSPTSQFGKQQHGDIQFGPWRSKGPQSPGGQIRAFNGTGEVATKELLAGASSLATTYNVDTGIYTLYMNKVLVASSYVADDFKIEGNRLLVARRPTEYPDWNTQVDFTGCVYAVAIWHRELAALEVEQYPKVFDD